MATISYELTYSDAVTTVSEICFGQISLSGQMLKNDHDSQAKAYKNDSINGVMCQNGMLYISVKAQGLPGGSIELKVKVNGKAIGLYPIKIDSKNSYSLSSYFAI
jgi:hypothetical protein